MSTAGSVTLDRFLDGRITVAQPALGFRAGHDSVLLAAAVPADAGTAVLELGSGAGVASLCLAARAPDVRIVGLEIDPELVRLANENAARNGLADRVSFVRGNVVDEGMSFPPPFAGEVSAEASAKADGGGTFHHVFFNPPFHPSSGHVSPVAARDRATRDTADAVTEWTIRALSLVRDGGTVTAIVRADRLDDILDAARGYGGIVFPLYPRAGADPKRAIVRIEKAKGSAFSHAAGLVLHKADGRNTEAAERVLRHAAALW